MTSSLSIANDTPFDVVCKIGSPGANVLPIFGQLKAAVATISLAVVGMGVTPPDLVQTGRADQTIVMRTLETVAAITNQSIDYADSNTALGVARTVASFVANGYVEDHGYQKIRSRNDHKWSGLVLSQHQQAHCMRTSFEIDRRVSMVMDDLIMESISSGAVVGSNNIYSIADGTDTFGSSFVVDVDPPSGLDLWTNTADAPFPDVQFLSVAQARWKTVGYRGTGKLPKDRDTTTDANCIISSNELQLSPYNVIPNDGVDDSAGIQAAIDTIGRTCADSAGYGRLSLIELPAGTINISTEIHLDVDFLILRGQGSADGGTMVVFHPGPDTRYDSNVVVNGKLDLGRMTAPQGASGGWIYPGRAAFRVQTRQIHPDYAVTHSTAAVNRKDFYEGSVNFHWKSGITLSKSALEGDITLALERVDGFSVGGYVWVGSANTNKMYDRQGVLLSDRICSHMRQQIFVVRQIGASSITIDKPLEFDVPVNFTSDGSPPIPCNRTTYESKVVPLHVVQGVGLMNFSLTQVVKDVNPVETSNSFVNIAPEEATHGILFKWAANGYIKGVTTYMTGSHPIVTEVARNMQFERNNIDGAWNKGKGGQGYFRNSKVWDSLVLANNITGLRHFTLQWSASGNVIKDNFLTCDINLHGGWERYNLMEGNTARVPVRHGGSTGWYPIFWSPGVHAGSWSGASGPQNVFFRNILTKQWEAGGSYEPYQPYGSSLQLDTIHQFGWDRLLPPGSRWQHLAVNGQPIVKWSSNEAVSYGRDPNSGVNSNCANAGSTLIGIDLSADCSPAKVSPDLASWCLWGEADGLVCCDSSCGRCGGSGCSALPGGATRCCSRIINQLCTHAFDTACIIPDELVDKERDMSSGFTVGAFVALLHAWSMFVFVMF